MKTLDPVTHGLIGAALSTLSGHPLQISDPVILGCTLGGMLPDLDIVTHVKGRLNYLLKHRGASHSVLALAGMALGLSTVLYTIFPATPWTTIFIWTLIGTLSHGIADVLNSYGAKLLWPFWRKKITVDMIMLTDPVICGFFTASLILAARFPQYAATFTVTAVLSGCLYLLDREIRRRKAKKTIMARYQVEDKGAVKIIPAMYRPFSWNFIIEHNNIVRFGTIRNGEIQIIKVLPSWDEKDPLILEALEGNLADIFNQFTPYYHVTIHQEDDGWAVEFVDLRYWSRKGFFYSGRVVLNQKGEIREETFYLPNKAGISLSY